MNEKLLQFIWQHQYFNRSDLKCDFGQDVSIIFPGYFNTDQGPDFLMARIRIGQTIWVGNIELHIRSSDWERHGHTQDWHYRNVVLHVVWMDDRPGKSKCPVLELKGRIPRLLLDQYEQWMQSPLYIPCHKKITSLHPAGWEGWKKQLLMNRLHRSGTRIREYLEESRQHWEESLWWLLARNFGLRVNSDAFESIARSVPLNFFSKLRGRTDQLEALLLGQAGLLSREFMEDYPRMLKNEYLFMREKFGLVPSSIPVFFLRMRPVNFPTVRLAQLATLMNDQAGLFSRLREADSYRTVQHLFQVKASPYWDYHYLLDELTAYRPKQLGEQMVQSIMINTVCPMLFTYGEWMKDNYQKEKALSWLKEIPAENNAIIRQYRTLGLEINETSSSQAILELKKYYCDEKRCLECAIGASILKKSLF